MTWKATVKDSTSLLEEGIYNASPIKITETEAKYGSMTRIDFIISSNDEFDGREVHGVCSTKITEKSKLGKWITAIKGRKPVVGDDITEDDILYKKCQVVIKHTQNDTGFVFANVTDVLPAEKGTIDE